VFNCDNDIQDYHDTRVKLSGEQRDVLKGHRDANRKRLKDGLVKDGKPTPIEHVRQGSDAMGTTTQHPENDYDIDDGALFNKEDLIGPKGGEMTALQVRQMVCNALQDERFKIAPEVKTNCVRVFYDAGYHVDIPAYRQLKNDESTVYELASVDWKESNPKGVTEWYEAKVNHTHSTDITVYQLDQIIRLLKTFGKSRPSWNMPSGLVWTVLASEQFDWPGEHLDHKFYDVIKAIYNRVKINKRVAHPVVREDITKTDNDPDMVQCEQHLSEALGWLDILFSSRCTRSEALKAWKKVFSTDFFDDDIKKAEEDEEQGTAIWVKRNDEAPSGPVDKRGGGRFA